MKKIAFKICAFVLGALISGFAVYAHSISASDISYKSSNQAFAANNVSSALDALYNEPENVLDKIDGTFSRALYRGYSNKDGLVTLNFTKGNYYALAVTSQGSRSESSSNSEMDYPLDERFIFNNMSCELISGKSNNYTSPSTSNSRYAFSNIKDLVLKCNVPSSGSMTIKAVLNTSTPGASLVSLIDAIKID